MAPYDRQHLTTEIRAIDGKLCPLVQTGIDLSQIRTKLRDHLRDQGERMRRQRPEIERLRQEADLLLPAMLDLYRNGNGQDRAELRQLLTECRSFRWGFGWGLVARADNAAAARDALAILSMKDGGSDYRDQIVALDHLCATMQRAGLPVAALLAEAAAWSSDVARFPPARSTRGLLLERAGRFAA